MFYAAVILLVNWSVFAHGMPMLRHDWRFPQSQNALGPMLASFFNGWIDDGIGQAQPYPTFYYLGFVLWPLHAVLTPLVTVITIVTASLALILVSTRSLASRMGGGALTACGLCAFAAFNPWVYSKLVAGHIVMVFAYAALLALVAEVLREKPREPVLLVLTALSVTQLEFCIIAFVPLGVWALKTRRYTVLIVLIASVLPLATGIAASFSSLLSMPFILEWQRAESVAPFSALTLTGYQFGYDRAFWAWRWCVAICVVIAALGIPALWRDVRLRVVGAIAFLCLLLAMGIRGPIGPIYTYAVTHVTEIGVFRELYDLLAIAAIGYAVAAACILGRWRMATYAFALCSGLLAVPWIAHPAYTWFVSGQTLPQSVFATDAATRVALFPAFQPLSYRGKGAGVDPDAYSAPGVAKPINEALPEYPVDVALSRALDGDLRSLAELSVATTIARPDYTTRLDILKYQLAFGRRNATRRPISAQLRALPLASLYYGAPTPTSIGTDLSEISTAPLVKSTAHFQPSRETINPSTTWVDARLAFIAKPDWGNPWGGVATTGRVPLVLPRGTGAILAETSNTLEDDRGAAIVRHSDRLHWWPVKSAWVRCLGECIVVAASPQVPQAPEHSSPPAYEALTLHTITPWLAYVDMPASHYGTLRYNVRYDRAWAAFDGGQIVAHLNLDGTFNGWMVAPHKQPRRIVMIETIAAVQLILEVLAAVVTAVLVVRSLRLPSPQASDRFGESAHP